MKPPNGIPPPPDPWEEDKESVECFEYRIKNTITSEGNPIFVIQRRKTGRHVIGNWHTYSLKTFHDKNEAQVLLQHLEGTK